MITQTVRILNSQVTPVYFFSESIFSGLKLYQYSFLPAWIVEAGFQPYIELLVMSPTVTVTGTFTYYFTLSTSPAAQDACLIIEVVDSLTDSTESCSTDASICLVWLNREGGRSSFIFDQRKDFKGVIGEAKKFDTNGVQKYISKGKNFLLKTVYKDALTNNEVDYLESLRWAIQAWEYNNTTGVSTPILIDTANYDLYSTKEKFNKIVLSYRMAAYKEIQNQ